MVLQNFIDLEKCVPVSSREACPPPSQGVNHFINIRVEEVSSVGEEEDPLLITSPQRKTSEQEVSCSCIYTIRFHLHIFVFPVMQPHCDVRILKNLYSEKCGE
jgi:hypothetical protein